MRQEQQLAACFLPAGIPRQSILCSVLGRIHKGSAFAPLWFAAMKKRPLCGLFAISNIYGKVNYLGR